MQTRKPFTIKKVVIMGCTIGRIVMIMTFFGGYLQHRKALNGPREGVLPKATAIGNLQYYASDSEGDHYYSKEQSTSPSANRVSVWNSLTYSDEGRRAYLLKRKQGGMFIQGLETLAQRNSLYDLKCKGKNTEFAIIEVFEVGKDGSTLDYARSGSIKDWETVPEGSALDKLAQLVCP
jgi:hypothetical protein